jgi:hypothetical protein
MGNSLTDHEDPEKRIADLEHRLAERNRDAPGAPASRRFEASAAPPSTRQMMKYANVYMFAGMAALGVIYMALFMIGALLGAEKVMQVGGAVVWCSSRSCCLPCRSMAWSSGG